MSDAVLLVEKDEGIVTLTLNRPHVMNAFSFELRTTVTKTFEDLKRDSEIRVVIITGAGRAFSAGMDLKELSSPDASFYDGEAGPVGLKMIRTIDAFDRPIIGAINGPAITGGFELALACDIRIASTEARFADTHSRVGLLPGWGMSQKLQRIIGPGRAKEMSFTGNFISAEQAEAWGLVNRVVQPEELMPTCLALAKDIVSCVPETVLEYKHLIVQGGSMTLTQGLQLEAKAYEKQAKRFSSDDVASRREGVLDRGRKQQ